MSQTAQIQEWYYIGEADITYGEAKANPLHKIMLTITLSLVALSSITAFIMRDYIYDYINNPRVILVTSARDNNNTVDVPYKQHFDPNKYIDTDYYYGHYGLLLDECVNNVNTEVIGTYKVVYVSQNHVTKNEETLTVNVKDLTPPTIKLKAVLNGADEYEPVVLVRGVHNDEKVLGTEDFNADDWLDSVTDDYCDKKDITITNTGHDTYFGLNGTTSTSIIYTAVDAYGNSSSVSLPLVIMSDYDKAAATQQNTIKAMEDELKKIQQMQQEQTEKQQQKQKENSSSTSSGTAGQSSKTANYVIDDNVLSATSFTWSLSLNGAVNMDFLIKASEFVTYYGTGTTTSAEGPSVTFIPTEPGVYTIVWTSTDGYKCLQQVNIIE